eukprot:TRINITY_DN6326_c0_g1_i1.p1 TRINITY_DN6326_c0_g1~~TRINITY_DN6326_c0_g1_i1.p1  ORF type:complete len:331 (+),score=70.01 TRINITY_DN6326_c0_g1_i1:130-993(+)
MNARLQLDTYRSQGSPPVSREEAESLWESKRIVDATIHPMTGEKIPLPFRMSAFVPMNVLITAGLLMPNPSINSVLFWQFVNQSYNIALNHSNRNASNELSNDVILKTYGAAVTISCGVAVGLGLFVNKSRFIPGSIRPLLARLVPFTAVSTAGIANVFLMRGNEAKEGIALRDEAGRELYGKSPAAGFKALEQTALSRVIIALPILTLPPLIMNAAEKSLLVRYPRLRIPLNLGIITTMLWAALPATLALFPQISSIPAKKLEPRFQGMKDPEGKTIETFYYNRGL